MQTRVEYLTILYEYLKEVSEAAGFLAMSHLITRIGHSMLETSLLKTDPKTLKFEEKILRLFGSGDKRKASNLIEKHLSEKNLISNTDVLKFILEPSGVSHQAS